MPPLLSLLSSLNGSCCDPTAGMWVRWVGVRRAGAAPWAQTPPVFQAWAGSCNHTGACPCCASRTAVIQHQAKGRAPPVALSRWHSSCNLQFVCVSPGSTLLSHRHRGGSVVGHSPTLALVLRGSAHGLCTRAARITLQGLLAPQMPTSQGAPQHRPAALRDATNSCSRLLETRAGFWGFCSLWGLQSWKECFPCSWMQITFPMAHHVVREEWCRPRSPSPCPAHPKSCVHVS